MRNIRWSCSSVFLLAVVCCGCGSWPPIVNNRSDIARLPRTTTSVRVRGLPDDDIPALARLPKLNELDFTGGFGVMDSRITDRGLASLASLQLPALQTLSLGYCSHITDTGLKDVATMRSVRWLCLMECPQITDAGLSAIKPMSQLTGLDLRGCPQISEQAIADLRRSLSSTQILTGEPLAANAPALADERAAPATTASVKVLPPPNPDGLARAERDVQTLKETLSTRTAEQLIAAFIPLGSQAYGSYDYYHDYMANIAIRNELAARGANARAALERHANDSTRIFEAVNGPADTIGRICRELLSSSGKG